uniref:Mitochondrial ribosome-associated GTPase 2 n=2 Tax=Timema TaxID=61471 RepID=A0A7R8VPU1_TIMDO|nr:unnamed protein product [Timema douglasi]
MSTLVLGDVVLNTVIQVLDAVIQVLDAVIQVLDAVIQGLDAVIQVLDAVIQVLDAVIQVLDAVSVPMKTLSKEILADILCQREAGMAFTRTCSLTWSAARIVLVERRGYTSHHHAVTALRSKKAKSKRNMVQHFVDVRAVRAVGGTGGDGDISFLQLWSNETAGPDGGDGGNGGHVVLEASLDIRDLNHVSSILKADPGERGYNKDCSGKNAAHTVVKVPVGTIVKTATGRVIADLSRDGSMFVAARGGAGGHGNHFFVSDTAQSPQVAEFGAQGEDLQYVLEVRSMAHIGLIGLPNAGKSTLLQAISRARPKIAPYPFTTLKPHLGMVQYDDYEQIAGTYVAIQMELQALTGRAAQNVMAAQSPDPRLPRSLYLASPGDRTQGLGSKPTFGFTVFQVVMFSVLKTFCAEDYEQDLKLDLLNFVADLPGLISGSHQNKGLGIAFLKHAERCAALMFVVDLSCSEPWRHVDLLRYELGQFSSELIRRPQVVVGNKLDLPESEENLATLKERIDVPVIPISAKVGTNLSVLLQHIRSLYDKHLSGGTEEM